MDPEYLSTESRINFKSNWYTIYSVPTCLVIVLNFNTLTNIMPKKMKKLKIRSIVDLYDFIVMLFERVSYSDVKLNIRLKEEDDEVELRYQIIQSKRGITEVMSSDNFICLGRNMCPYCRSQSSAQLYTFNNFLALDDYSITPSSKHSNIKGSYW